MSSTATAEIETSGLTLADVGKKSEMEGLGWSVNQADDKTWSAHEKAGELRDIGPAATLGALHTQVKLAATDKPKAIKVGSSTLEDGEFVATDQRLPTMDEPEIDELNALADLSIAAFEKKKSAATASKDQDDLMRLAMHKHERKRYSRRGWSIVVEDTEKLVIKKAEGPKKRAAVV